jgi:hypothetical protein
MYVNATWVYLTLSPLQGCQMVYFQTKNPNFGKFLRVWQWKMLLYFMDIWTILQQISMLYGHLVYFMVNWYFCSHFGMQHKEKSGNPGLLFTASLLFFTRTHVTIAKSTMVVKPFIPARSALLFRASNEKWRKKIVKNCIFNPHSIQSVLMSK